MLDGFLSLKNDFDVTSQAVKLAKSAELPQEQVDELMKAKHDLKAKFLAASQALMKEIKPGTNMVYIGEGWWAIRYLGDKREPLIKIDLLAEQDIHIIQRDTKTERDLLRIELDTLVPGIIDRVAFDLYKQSLNSKAKEMIKVQYGVCLDVEDVDKVSDDVVAVKVPNSVSTNSELFKVRVSLHAGKRYVQRKMGIFSDSQAEDYYKANSMSVITDILNQFNSADILFEDMESAYWFDDNNTLFIVNKADKMIVTLYEEDYGFSKEINHMIVIEQAKVLQTAYNNMIESEYNLSEVEANVSKKAEQYDASIVALQDEIDYWQSQKDALLVNRDVEYKAVKAKKSVYCAEYSKLFSNKKG